MALLGMMLSVSDRPARAQQGVPGMTRAYGIDGTVRPARPDTDEAPGEPMIDLAELSRNARRMPLPRHPESPQPEIPAGRGISIDLRTREVTHDDPRREHVAPDRPLESSGSLGGRQTRPLEGAGAGEERDPRNFTSLQPVDDPTQYPYAPHVKLFQLFTDRSGGRIRYQCSGTLIDPYHVLTAGHCVYLHGNVNDFADSIDVIPAYENGAAPFGTASSTRVHSWAGWVNSGSFDHDIAIIDLDRPIGATAGWHGYATSSSCSFYLGTTFTNPGYPSEPPYTGETMHSWTGSFDGCEGSQVYFDRYSFGGQSGSGAVRFRGDDSFAHAVLSNGTTSRTWDVTITADKFATIRDNYIGNDRPGSFDLHALDVQVEQTTVAAGGAVSLSYLVLNYSEAAHDQEVTAAVYLSTNGSISPTDMLVQTHRFTYSFDPVSMTRIEVPALTIPPVTDERLWQVGVILDVADADEGNNDSSDIHTDSLRVRGRLSGRCNARSIVAGGSISPTSLWQTIESSNTPSTSRSFSMVLPEAGEYDLSLCADEGSAEFDTWLCLFDSGFDLLDQNDDSCGLQSRLARSLPAGTYHVAVSGFQSAAGDFTLAYRKVEPPPAQDPSFVYSFAGDCGHRLNGPAGRLFSSVVDCRLTTTTNTMGTGADAWSVGVTAEGAQIAVITTQETVGASVNDDPPGLRRGGFEHSELTSGPSNRGAISSVILSFAQAVTLPPSGAVTIARIEIQTPYPDTGRCRAVRLDFTDGLVGSGTAVLNRVHHDSGSRAPTLESCGFNICGSESSVEFELGFAGPCDSRVEDSPGRSVVEQIDCTLTTRDNTLDVGARAWEVGMSAQGGSIVDITTLGTVGASETSDPPGLRRDGFEISEITTGVDNEGAISAVVLSFTQLVTLPPAGTVTIARIAIEAPAPEGDRCTPVRVFYRDGLQGRGQPVNNSIAHGEFHVRPVGPAFVDCTFEVCGKLPEESYPTFDCNGDGWFDLSDAVCHLGILFGGRESAFRCPAAMDFNGDGHLDVSDPIAALSHLFLGGPESPNGSGCRSYPGCDAGPTCD